MSKKIGLSLLLTCATGMEMRAVLKGLGEFASVPALDDAAPQKSFIAESHELLPSCEILGASLYFLVCGVGPVASAWSLGRVLGGAERSGSPIHGVINMGLAGSYDLAAAPVGSLVLATEERWPEYGLRRHDREMPLPLNIPQGEGVAGSMPERLCLAPDKALGKLGLNCHSACLPSGGRSRFFRLGPSVTVAGVSGTPEQAHRLAKFTGGLTENMEGFSLAFGSAALGLPFVEARAVSNAAGSRPPHTWDIPLAQDALARAAFLLFGPPASDGKRNGVAV